MRRLSIKYTIFLQKFLKKLKNIGTAVKMPSLPLLCIFCSSNFATTPGIGTPRFNQQFAHKSLFTKAFSKFQCAILPINKIACNGWCTTKKLKNNGTAVEMPSLPLFCHFCSSNFATTPGIGTPRLNQQFAHKCLFTKAFSKFHYAILPINKLPANGWRTTLTFSRRATTLKRPCFTTSHAILLLFYLYLSIL